jgi:hypothetical protein
MKNYINIFLITLTLSVFSCQDVLDIEPAQSLSVAESLSDFNGLQTALFGAYDGLQNVSYYGRDFVVNPEVGGENVYISINNSNRFLINYQYIFNSFQTDGDFWNQGYAVILSVNNIINSIEGIPDGTVEDKNQVLGEALFLRALVHFDLTREFCAPYAEGTGANTGIPIMLEAAISTPPRNTLAEVYTQVIADLTQAKGLMNQDLGAFRAGLNATNALLARVALYQGNNAEAEARATDVINAGYTLTPGAGLPAFFASTGNSEEIWSLKTAPDETAGSNNLGQIYNPQGYGDIRVTSDIRDSYEAGDLRTALYYLSTDGEYYNGKFLGEEGVPGLVSTKIFRLAEMYLIRAEARAKQSNFTGATADVDVIRQRAGLAVLASDVDLEGVLIEKNREFAFEGHRTFDLWRNGKPLVRVQANTGLELPAPAFIAADSYLRVYPIPQAELDVNPEIVQASGY